MNKTVKTLITTIAVALLGSSLCQQTQAAPIVGDIGFFGAASASSASPGAPNVTISFTNPWQVLDVTPGSTYEANGVPVFLPLPAVTFSNFSFSGDGAGAALTGPVLPEWSFSFGGIAYSFDLTSLTNGHVELTQAGVGSMSFTGLGTVHADGFDDTPATWSLEGAGTGLVFTLSSSTTASVPEGGAVSLLGLGFAMLAGRSLIRRNKSI